MSLMDEIKAQQLQARKDRNPIKAALLTTLIGEASVIGKNDGNRETTDAEVVTVVKKFIKNTNEMLSALDTSVADALTNSRETALTELQILNSFLPKQMTEEELKMTVEAIKLEIGAAQKDMGKVMGLLKSRYDGQYDGKMASSIVKAVLAG